MTRRNCASSQPISTASSSASCAMFRSSPKFSFRTLSLSTHDTASPVGVRHTVSVKGSLLTWPPRGIATLCLADMLLGLIAFRIALLQLRRSLALVALSLALLRLALAEDVLADEVFEAHRRLGEFDLAAGFDHVVGGAGHQREVLVAEEPTRQDFGDRVGRQLHDRVDGQLHDRQEVRRVERLRDDAADLDAADAHIAALADTFDAIELCRHLIA